MSKPEVVHFQRKPRGAGNFSVEFIFEDVRNRLRDKINFKIIYAREFSNGVWKRLVNIIDAARKQGEINHVTGDILYLNLLFNKHRTITTVLDCGFMESSNPLKRGFHWLFWLKLPERKSRYLTAISEATKQDIIKYTKCQPDKVIVIPVAVSQIFKPFPREFNKNYPVILQIGTAFNKNLFRLVEALTGLTCKLHIIGHVSEDLKRHLERSKIDYNNQMNISMQELYDSYVNCDIVSFISTLEGFGMPIVEANCVERVVVTGNITSMPEVAGNAACCVDPYSVASMRSGILRVINDDDYRQQLIENGRINKERFRSEVIAEMYYKLYSQLHQELSSKPVIQA